MKISLINSYNINRKSFGKCTHTEYTGQKEVSLSEIQMDIKAINEKIDESKQKEDIILQQNNDILKALYLMSRYNDPFLKKNPAREQIKSLCDKYSSQ